MTTIKILEQAIVKLPLSEREAMISFIKRNISDEYDRLAEASLADDMRTIERRLAKFPVAHDQVDVLELLRDAAQ